ncbi:sigma-70 family RNA polymerase sigma factor [Planctomicrobium sp. SH668]|uniref:sigma-70 family RNA polymerase sigma factor n=1 Tax=Planctomicrobium sp. SH668 TaxID=3448126 RepID=UPI003F5CA971
MNSPRCMKKSFVDLRNEVGHWGDFVADCRPMIVGIGRKRGISPQELKDYVQTVLTALLHSIATVCQPRRGFIEAWIYRVAVNKAIDIHRHQRRQRRLLENIAHQLTPSMSVVEVENDTRRAILKSALVQVRAEFQEKTWQCFLRHSVRQEPAHLVGKDLGLSENAVYVNSSRITARVRQYCRNRNASEQLD